MLGNSKEKCTMNKYCLTRIEKKRWLGAKCNLIQLQAPSFHNHISIYFTTKGSFRLSTFKNYFDLCSHRQEQKLNSDAHPTETSANAHILKLSLLIKKK
jgi:hypothetical protein